MKEDGLTNKTKLGLLHCIVLLEVKRTNMRRSPLGSITMHLKEDTFTVTRQKNRIIFHVNI